MAKINMRYVPYQERHPLIQWAFKQKLPLKHVCAGIGVTRVALCHWDNGRARPSGRILSNIIQYTSGAVTPDTCHAYWLGKQGKEVA